MLHKQILVPDRRTKDKIKYHRSNMRTTTSKKTVAKKGFTSSPKPKRNAVRFKHLEMKNPSVSNLSKRGETIEFKDLTHRVIDGLYKGFEGIVIRDEEETATFRCLKNIRGNKMYKTKDVAIANTQVRELTSYDMIESVGKNFNEEEDEDDELVEYENGTWECSKCNAMNRNDSGYCPNLINGKLCGGTVKCEMKTWAGCFTTNLNQVRSTQH